jgi:EpsI family protein
MITRFFLAVLILLGMYGAAQLVRDRGMPTRPAALEMKVEDLPLVLGEWRGEAVALDPEMFKAIGAEMAMDRRYRNRRGQAVSLHVAVFQLSRPQALPHSPEVCYPAGGWQLGEPLPISLDQGGKTVNAAKLLPAERRGETVYVLYWYQIDGHAYYTGDRQRQLTLALRGRPARPPIVKVMLQTAASSPEDAEKILLPLAAEVFAWTSGFH